MVSTPSPVLLPACRLDIKLSKSGYRDSYSNFQANTANSTSLQLRHIQRCRLNSWNVPGIDWSGTVSAANPPTTAMTNMIAGTRGIIRARTADASSTNIPGAAVYAYSWRNHGQLYKVVYGDSVTGIPIRRSRVPKVPVVSMCLMWMTATLSLLSPKRPATHSGRAATTSGPVR